MDDEFKVIEFNRIDDSTEEEILSLNKELRELKDSTNNDQVELDALIKRIQTIAEKIGADNVIVPEYDFEDINKQIDIVIKEVNKGEIKYDKLPKLEAHELIFSSIAGIISVLVDVIFVGTPEVVKIYRGGENFDGSILTSALRNIGRDEEGELTGIFDWCSDKFKVPYDISLKSGIVTPNNHRLRSFAHDPFLGLLFAVADIILGTTTCFDNKRKLAVLVNKNKASAGQKWLSVIYYMGHIISDVCTARGIPIPSFFITQFFRNGDGNASIAKIAESMYMDGYDLRHMASMSVPVFIKNALINSYIKMNNHNINTVISIAEKEKQQLDIKLRTNKMMFVANSISTLGNTIKFISPPNCGNPCALNLVQWTDFIRNSIFMAKAITRDFSTEEGLYNRREIDKRWKELLQTNF
jgi:hypothetical protein